MRKTAKILAVVLTLVMLVSLAACGGSGSDNNDNNEAKSALIGKWESVDAPGTFYEFNEDGKGVLSGTGYSMDFTYTEKDNKIELSRDGELLTFKYEYAIEGDTLSLKDEETGTTLTYSKK